MVRLSWRKCSFRQSVECGAESEVTNLNIISDFDNNKSELIKELL